MSEHAHTNDGEVHAHISPVGVYIGIFAVLIVFTLLTYAVSWVHLGAMNLLVAVIIATIKATLVVMYFMHLKYDARFHTLLLVAALFFGGVFMAYTLNDTEHRGRVGHYGRYEITRTGEAAEGGMPRRARPDAVADGAPAAPAH
jgi:cytochrome c oxidase subunit IV